jgi:hypothetical protein
MLQVVVEVAGSAAEVLIGFCPFSFSILVYRYCIRCVITIVVATYI